MPPSRKGCLRCWLASKSDSIFAYAQERCSTSLMRAAKLTDGRFLGTQL